MSMDSTGDEEKIKDRLINEYLPLKFYHRHSDIDLYINITITQLLNYKTLLTDELNEYILENYRINYNYYDDIKEQKERILKSIFSQKSKIAENQSKYSLPCRFLQLFKKTCQKQLTKPGSCDIMVSHLRRQPHTRGGAYLMSPNSSLS